MADLIERIPEGITPGPWKWWTSNSWRRLHSHAHRIEQRVLMPYVARDGQPDCDVSQEDMALIALAPELAAGYRAQAARIAELEAEVARLRKPFEPCDDQDWRRLWSLLGGSAFGRFWKDTLKEARAALAAPDTGGAADGE